MRAVGVFVLPVFEFNSVNRDSCFEELEACKRNGQLSFVFGSILDFEIWESIF